MVALSEKSRKNQFIAPCGQCRIASVLILVRIVSILYDLFTDIPLVRNCQELHNLRRYKNVSRERNPMHRREWLKSISIVTLAGLSGCRGYQYGHVIKPTAANMVGSHEAGAEVFDPLIDEAVAKLLARQNIVTDDCPIGPNGQPMKKSICFVGIENKSAEDIGDFKDKIYNQIDSKILESSCFQSMSKRMVDAALHETRMRPDALLLPDNMRLFTAVLERSGAPVDYLLYAQLTSGTTKRNSSTQRDYELTLELVNVHTGMNDKLSSEVRKGYHKTAGGKFWNYNPLKR